MTRTSKTIIYVCSTCRPDGFVGADEARPGARLWRELVAHVETNGSADAVEVRGVECLSVCKRPCTVAFSAPGKFTYVIGDLEVERDCEAVFDFAKLYSAAADGITVWRQRPEVIRKHTVARIPPFGHEHAPVLSIDAMKDEASSD